MNQITQEQVLAYQRQLMEDERSRLTIDKYQRDLRHFRRFCGPRAIHKGLVIEWKASLIETYAPATVNSMLAAVNGF